jgi:hypothetical protein
LQAMSVEEHEDPFQVREELALDVEAEGEDDLDLFCWGGGFGLVV